MKYIGAFFGWGGLLLCGGLLLLGGYATYDTSHSHSFRTKAGQLKVGVAKTEVEAVMGSPTYRHFVSAGGGDYAAAERWTYGSHLDWHRPFTEQFPYVAPLKDNPANPDPNDVVVDFDSSERVARIQVPRL
jgi:outer membrane protein assembly factor BamE (lipoprotein component of BamABCDE complex)